MRMTIPTKYKALLFLAITSLIFAILIITPNYRHYPFAGLRDILLIVGHWGLSSLGLFVLISIMALNRYVYFLLFPVFVLAGSAAAYFTWQIDSSINAALIESLILTNAGEVNSYISKSLLCFVFISVALACLSVVWRLRITFLKKDYYLVTFLVIISSGLFYFVNQNRYNTFMVRNPFSFYLAIKEYQANKVETNGNRTMLGLGANAQSDTIFTVLVIGEALRADHLQMNGYHRETMPRMETRGVISLPHIFTPYTYTAASLRYILTRAHSGWDTPMYEESSFIDIFNQSKFYTAWIANQNPITSFSFFVNECDTVIINKPYFSDYSNSAKYDSDLIEPFKRITANEKAKKLIILHIAGNHWWYNNNLPDDFIYYTPILENKTVSTSNRERMINSYDNVTRFTDAVLDELISYIEDKNAVLLFLADHGQSFGEDGKWLHTNDTPPEQNPACFIWFSESYKLNYPEKVVALLENQHKEIDTSFLFHSIIDASDIKSEFSVDDQSVFSFRFLPK